MKPFVIDIGRLERRLGRATPTGVDRVILAYALELKARFPNEVIFVRTLLGLVVPYRPKRAQYILSLTARNWETGSQTKPSLIRTLISRVFEALLLTLRGGTACKEPFLYFTLDHNGLDENGAVEKVKRKPHNKVVMFLHDLIPLTHPEYVVPKTVGKHRQRMRAASTSVDLVIANSKYTRRVFETYLRSQSLPVPRTEVAYLGTHANWNVRDCDDGFRSSKPRFVVLGTIEARKNHLLLLNVWRRMIEQNGADTPELHVVGRRGWEAEAAIDMLDRSPALRRLVFEHHNLSDDSLLTLVRGARALLFPSFVEGFGLPLTEALASGIPAIVADIPTFREIAGDIPEFIDPIDANGWQDLILDYASPVSMNREAQLRRMKEFSGYSWDQHFDVVSQALVDLSGEVVPEVQTE